MRPNKTEYGLELAQIASTRSEDPRMKVGAVAMTGDGRVVATAYNGLLAGMEKPDAWWHSEDGPDGLAIHAEQNLLALFTQGDVETVCLTHEPCSHCLRSLIASGVRKVYFRRRARKGSHTGMSHNVARFYGITYQHWPKRAGGLSQVDRTCACEIPMPTMTEEHGFLVCDRCGRHLASDVNPIEVPGR